MRIAGVDVGKVSEVEAVGGDSPGVQGDDEARGRGAADPRGRRRSRSRERIFLEGNLFFDIRPGSPERATSSTTATRSRPSQTSAPVQIDQVLGTLKTDTRKDLQELLEGYGDALNGQPEPGEDDDQDPDVQGETAGQALNDSLDYSADALRGAAVVNEALLGTEPRDLSKLVAGQQRVFEGPGRAASASSRT